MTTSVKTTGLRKPFTAKQPIDRLANTHGIDFNDIVKVEKLAAEIIAKAKTEQIVRNEENGAGNLVANTVAKATREKGYRVSIETVIEAENWIMGVEAVIDGMTPADKLRTLASYDTIHRIAFRKKASDSFMRKHLLSVFEARIRMDRTIDDHLLFRMITDAVEKRRDKAFFGRPLQWQSLCLERWYRQFRTGNGLEDLSDYDIAQRVSILLETDLWAFDPRHQSAFKHHLLTTYRPLLSTSRPLLTSAAPHPKSHVIEST